jgi:hypothetical protein
VQIFAGMQYLLHTVPPSLTLFEGIRANQSQNAAQDFVGRQFLSYEDDTFFSIFPFTFFGISTGIKKR